MIQDHNLARHFETIFKTHYSSVKHFIFFLLKSEQDAEDLAQDVFTRLWSKPEIWSNQEESNGYIFTTARNVTLNFIKHKKLEQHYQEEQIQENLIKELCVSEDPLNPIYHDELQLILDLALNRLPTRRKMIFEMSRLNGMSNQEIASTLNISVRTVEHQIYLTLQELKKIIFIVFFLHFL